MGHLRTRSEHLFAVAVDGHGDGQGVVRLTHAPGTVVLLVAYEHLEVLVDLGVLGLGPRGQVVLLSVRLRTLGRHRTLMLLLVERLQVSADRFT